MNALRVTWVGHIGPHRRRRGGLRLVSLMVPLLAGCFAAPLPSVSPEQIGPDGLSLLGPREIRIVGVTTSYETCMFDTTPPPRVSRDAILARCGNETRLIDRSEVSTLWVAGPGEFSVNVATADVPKALAYGLAHPFPAVGQSVHIWAPSSGLHGDFATIAVLSADSIGVVLPYGGSLRTLKVPVDSVRRLELSRGLKGHPREGFLAGALVGAIVGAASDPGSPGAWMYLGRGGQALILGVLLAVPGTAIGSLIRTEHWEVVPHERLVSLMRHLPRAPAR